MARLDTLVSVQIDLATAAFTSSSFSRMAVCYQAATPQETAPQIISSAEEALQVSSLTTTSMEYRALNVAFTQSPGATQVLLIPVQPAVPAQKGGSVNSVVVTEGGSGFTSAPTVTFTGSGSGAQATAIVSGGAVTGINITNGGSGYSIPPTVSFSGDGSGAAAVSTITPDIPEVTYASQAITAFANNASAISGLGGYFGVWFGGSFSDQVEFAAFANGARKLYVTMDNTGDAGSSKTTDLCSVFQQQNYDFCAAFAAPEAASYPTYFADIAAMSKAFGYQPGSENWSNMTLSGVKASDLTESQRQLVLSKNGNTFMSYGNDGGNAISLTFKGTTGSGRYLDEIRGREWLCNEIRTAVANYLLQRPKVPFTDAGISGAKNVILAVLENALRVGFLDGPSIDSNGNVQPSYTVTVPRRSAISSSDVQARALAGITFTARLAGAIDTVTGNGAAGIQGTLVYNNF